MRRLVLWAVVCLLFGCCHMVRAQDVLFQDFYWDIAPPEGESWWTYIEGQLPALAKAGIGSVWVPAPYKGGVGRNDMGYGPYDLYDLGSKDQKGTVATRFGTKDEFLRFVATAHRIGIKVYADVVLNHASGADYAEANPVMEKLGWNDIPDQSKIPAGDRSPDSKPGEILRSWTGFAPKGADGKLGTGRFPRTWRDFHPNEAEPDRNAPYHEKEFGQDYAFRGDDDYVRKSMIAWSHWFAAQSGVDGYRMDDVKGMEPDFVADFAEQGPPKLWIVGEYLDGDPTKVMDYYHLARGAVNLFDYPLYFALKDMTFKPETFDMNDLLQRRMPDRDAAVTFVGNHDMSRDSAVIVYHVPLAYAVILAMSGTPSVYYSDFWRAGDALRAEITALVQAHNALAVGPEIVRHVDKTTLALERQGHLLAVFNSGGDGKSHQITVPTDFGPNVRLTDHVGSGKPVVTDAQGRAKIQIAPYSYAYYAPVTVRAPTTRKSLPTSQTWEFADDLDTGRLSESPQTIRVTLAAGEALDARLTVDDGAAGEITAVGPDDKALKTAPVTLAFKAVTAGVYQLRVRTTDEKKVHGALTVKFSAAD
jgi:alpha-amylase